MSSPASGISTLVNDFVSGIVSLLDAFAQALSTYAPTIVEIVVGVGLVAGIGYAMTRIPFIRRFLGWIGL
ncbi:hypothetical protein [Acidilobus sp.]|jgi:Ni/Fe-hydrogenase subunit HybB-like protein|uniref:hypothetical protein n=1 Tax=Acidilobus sp. TaxID=1872109 RepID=UPI003D01DB6F